MFEKQKFLSNMQYTYYVLKNILINFSQRWSRGHKARGQGQGHKKNPRPRTALPRTEPLEAKDKKVRGQGPRAQMQGFSKKKFFSGDLKKKVFKKKLC